MTADCGMDRIITVIREHTFSLGHEKDTQEDMARVFKAIGLPMRREVEVAPGSVIDFLGATGIGVEVKLKGSPRSIYRQLERYTASGAVKGIVLATNRAMGLPETINGVPARVVSLGSAWL